MQKYHSHVNQTYKELIKHNQYLPQEWTILSLLIIQHLFGIIIPDKDRAHSNLLHSKWQASITQVKFQADHHFLEMLFLQMISNKEKSELALFWAHYQVLLKILVGFKKCLIKLHLVISNQWKSIFI